MKIAWIAVLAFALVTPLSSCMLFACTLELSTRLTPRSVELDVGETVTPTFKLLTCGGSQTVPDTFVWTSDNPTVATVSRTTGEITAVGVGKAIISVEAQENQVNSSMQVTVTDN